MKQKILILCIVLFCLLPAIQLEAQISGDKISKRFLPSAGLTYNFHTMNDIMLGPPAGSYQISHFPGIEFGFILKPKTEDGWMMEYKNTFLGELLMYGIADQWANPYRGILNDIVDRTICNGFIGRLDIGKAIIQTPIQKLNMGFSVSEKIIFGTDDYPIVRYPDQETYTNTGFHFTPGIYSSYQRYFPGNSILTVNLSFSQSLFNLHQFGEDNAIDNFVLPLFIEFDINYRIPSGVYFKTGTIIATSFNGVPADARISLGAGYTFRYARDER